MVEFFQIIKSGELVNFSIMLEHLKTIFVSFPVGEIHYVTNNDNFMFDLSNILNNALTDFPNCIFYIMGDFFYQDLIDTTGVPVHPFAGGSHRPKT